MRIARAGFKDCFDDETVCRFLVAEVQSEGDDDVGVGLEDEIQARQEDCQGVRIVNVYMGVEAEEGYYFTEKLLVDEEKSELRCAGGREAETGTEHAGWFVKVAVGGIVAEIHPWIVEQDLLRDDVSKNEGADLGWEREKR